MTAAQWFRVAILGGLLALLTAKTGIWGLVIVLGIVLMVFLHELGHFVAAKRSGMAVTEFFIGFGPRIWSFKRGETEYGLKVIPAGAYVKIIGMHNLEEVDPALEGRTYRQGKFHNRFMVVVAGPLMNMASALVIIWIVLAVTGTAGGSISRQPDEARWKIDKVYPGTGAAEAGIRQGDKITAIDGQKVVIFEDLKPLITPRVGDTVAVTYTRAGISNTVPVELHAYRTADGDNACCLGVRQYLLDWDTKKVAPLAAIPQSFSELGSITGKSMGAFGKFFSPSGISSFGRQVANAHNDPSANPPVTTTPPRTAPSASSSGSSADTPAGQDRLLSLIGVFNIGTTVANSGLAPLLVLFVVLNISLGIINLVPLLPFDGGHAAIAVYEKLQELRRRTSARYFTDVARLLPLTYVVVMILVGIFITTTYLDIANPLRINK